MKVEFAPDIEEKAFGIIKTLKERGELSHVFPERLVFMRSNGSKANAIARIWELPRIWQKALNVESHYVIEFLSEHFDLLPSEEQEKTIIHELLHIPKTFSGAIVPHMQFGKSRVGRAQVEEMHRKYKKI